MKYSFTLLLVIIVLVFQSCEKELIRNNPLDAKGASSSGGSTSNITMAFESYDVTSDNNNDGAVNKGESVKLLVRLGNTGNSKVNKVKGTITCSNSYVSNLTNSGPHSYHMYGSTAYDYINAGTYGSVNNASNYLGFDVSSSAPAGTELTFNVTITDESNNTWVDSFTVTVVSTGASLSVQNYDVTSDNNNDGAVNKGESVKLLVRLGNTGNSKVNKVKGTITCSNSYVSNLTNSGPHSYHMYGSTAYDYINAGTYGSVNNASNYLGFDVSSSAPAGTELTFNVTITDESNNTWVDSFTVTVVSTGASLSVQNYDVTSDNNNDGVVNKGETVKLLVRLGNTGSSRVNKVKGTITCSNSYVSNLTNSGPHSYYMYGSTAYDYINAGTYGSLSSSSSYLGFDVSSSTPDGTVLIFNVTITDESNNTWVDSFTVTVVSTGASLSVQNYDVTSDNNNDGVVNKGETVKLLVRLGNTGSSRVNKVKGTITCSNSYVSNLTNSGPYSYYMYGSTAYDYINAGTYGSLSSSSNYLGFDVSSSTPAGTVLTFNVTITDESSNTWTDNFNLTVQ